ncbi:hypothetical protein F4810DRAFT_433301 [Camillea tinctor]|nr:hypothetical protein F4810DRAFT_433301 [Camillea tinctor]
MGSLIDEGSPQDNPDYCDDIEYGFLQSQHDQDHSDIDSAYYSNEIEPRSPDFTYVVDSYSQPCIASDSLPQELGPWSNPRESLRDEFGHVYGDLSLDLSASPSKWPTSFEGPGLLENQSSAYLSQYVASAEHPVLPTILDTEQQPFTDIYAQTAFNIATEAGKYTPALQTGFGWSRPSENDSQQEMYAPNAIPRNPNELDLTCPTCFKAFQKDEMPRRRHFHEVHEKPQRGKPKKGWYMCRCGMAFARLKNYENHGPGTCERFVVGPYYCQCCLASEEFDPHYQHYPTCRDGRLPAGRPAARNG